MKLTVHVDQPYDVIIGNGLLGEVNVMLGSAQRVAIIHPPTLAVTADTMRQALLDEGRDAITIEVPDGENAKSAPVLEYCWNVLGTSGFTRTDAIVGVGGGSTTDLAGFVAATWLRGISVIQVPTTLLAMVDAAVGGKTGINTAAGKNLVGAFHSPRGVVCDLNTLESLPEHDLTAGLAEVIKVGLVADPTILEIIESGRTREDLPELVRRAIAVKADVVAADFTEEVGREALGREVLNYGHTFGHAIEKVEGYTWRHGAAVSVGMMYVAELARLAGRLSDEDVERHRSVLATVGLPTTYRPGQWDALHAAMLVDKKTRGSMLRFVVLDGIGHPAVLEGPDPALLVSAYDAISNEEAV